MALEAENGRLRGTRRPAISAALLAGRKPCALITVVLMLAVMSVGAASLAQAEQEQSYGISESPIRVLSDNKPFPGYPVISGKWVIWQDVMQDARRIWAATSRPARTSAFLQAISSLGRWRSAATW